MRKIIAVIATMAVIVGAGASAAFAGEITGNGKPTPIEGFVATSICAFNGLNDFNQGQTDSRVQTPRDAGYPGAAAFGWAPDPSDPEFILVCNPNGPVAHG